jgi:two-component system NarL family response regulator
MQVVGEADSGPAALAAFWEKRPDVTLLDLRLPGMHGAEVITAIRKQDPFAKVLVLTSYDAGEDVYRAMQAGASGYLLKEVDPTEVAAAVRQIHAGHSLLSPAVASKLVSEFATMAKRTDERSSRPKLTDRELEVLKLAADGLTNRQIGRRLHISENTVKNHMRNILEKLHLHSRMEAVLYAVREELIDLDGQE